MTHRDVNETIRQLRPRPRPN